jgi:Iron-containing redox enzyme
MEPSVRAPDRAAPARPPLPEPRGPLSGAVTAALARAPGSLTAPPPTGADPFGEDLHLALYTCYELHYRGFAGADPEWEWDPGLLRLRGALERLFLAALRERVPAGTDVDAALEPLLTEAADGTGVSHHLRARGRWWQVREYLAHRSLYHLKEADPQTWVIPRLEGREKAALVAVEFDEFGGGHADRLHARLFAEMMAETGLDPTYGRYLDLVPAPMLAVVDLMSLLGLHRSLRGAMVGHFAAVETSSPPGARRMVRALERLGAGPRCTRFYAEHVEADAVHEQVMRREVIGGLLDREPDLAADVVFGIRATALLEERLTGHLLTSWRAGETSLRAPLPEEPEAPDQETESPPGPAA